MNPTRHTPAPRGARRQLAALLRTIAGGSGAAAILAGLPYLLATRIGWPLPRRWMGTRALVQDVTTRSLNATAVLDTLAVVLWTCWIVLLLGAASELAAAALRRPAPQIPGLRPGQVLAAALIALIGVSILRPAAPAGPHPELPAPSRPTGQTTTTAAAPTATHQHTAARTDPQEARAASQETAIMSDAGTSTIETVTVRSGQTLFGIAETYTGSGQNWPALFQLNADRPEPGAASFTDPNLIRPGWRIEVPIDEITNHTGTSTTGSTPSPAHSTTPTQANGRTAAPSLPDQAATPIPSSATSTGTRASTAPAAPTASATHTPRGPGSETAPDGANPTAAAAPARRHGAAAVLLPDGGAIGITLAVALGSALVLARRWRTRRADPRFPEPEPHLPAALLAARRAHLATPARTETDLENTGDGLVGENAEVQPNGLRVPADEEPDAYFDPEPDLEGSTALEDDPGYDFADAGLFEQDPSAAHHGPDPVVFAAPLPPGSITTAERDGAEIPLRPTGPGLGLIGPGAAGAARAIAASVLSAGAPDRTGDLARLIIPAADLAMLLDLDATDLPAVAAAVPELYITDDLPAALAEAEVNALLRTRLLAETDAADLDAMAREHPDVEECPPLVVMASPQRAETGRIGALIDQSAPLRITTVLLGSHPRSATVYVDADGHTEGADLAEWTGARMFNLPATDFTDVLDLLAAAAGHPSTPAPASVPRPDLALVQDTPAQEADEPDESAVGTTSRAEDLNQAADSSGQSAEPARQPVGAPRLMLVEDPADKHAEAMLAAWDQRPVRISVLGPLRIDADGASVTKLRSQARPIAALLAWKGPAGASDQQIDTTCWPDEDDPARIQQWRQDGLKSLRSRLRTATGRKTAQFIVLRDRRDYVLEPDHATVDLWVLQALEAAASANRDPQAKLHYLTRAAEFCTGELMAEETGADFAWVDGPRVTVTALQVSVLARLAELAADDQPDKALAALRQAAAMAVDNEHLHLRIIDLLAALGRHTEIPTQLQVLTAHADAMGAAVSQAARAHAAKAMRTADART